MIIPIPVDCWELPPLEDSPWIEFERRIREKTTIDRRTGCWLFNGALVKGHGVIRKDKKNHYVHRISAAIYLGYDLLDKTHQVNHIDDLCPYPNCWWYEHLYIGTIRDNMIDAMTKGVWYSPNANKTHCKYGHEFTPENTIIFPKSGQRSCRICSKERDKKRYEASRGR